MVALLGLSLPFILRSIDYKALLVWQLENQLNRKVEIANARVQLFPHVRIALEGVTVRDANSPTPFMSADRLFVDLRVFPLLARKVVVKRVILNRPVLGITRGPDGKLNIADLFTSTQGSVAVPMLGEEITIVEGLRLEWPAGEAMLPLLVAAVAATSWFAVQRMRRAPTKLDA